MPHLIVAGHLFDRGDYMEPGAQYTEDFPVAIPLDRYDTVEAIVFVGTGFGDRLRLEEADMRSGSSTELWRLGNTSLASRLTMGRQQLSVRYDLVSDESGPLFDLDASTSEVPADMCWVPAKDNPRTNSTFGLVTSTAGDEIALTSNLITDGK